MTTASRGGPAAASASAAEDIERAYFVADQLRQQLALLEEQRSLLAASRQDLERALAAVEAVRGAAPGDRLMVPLGAGTFVRAAVEDPAKLVAYVGAGVHVESAPDEVAARLRERMEGTDRAMQRLAEESKRVAGELDQVARELQAAQGG